jgi:hypothetical protein
MCRTVCCFCIRTVTMVAAERPLIQAGRLRVAAIASAQRLRAVIAKWTTVVKTAGIR